MEDQQVKKVSKYRGVYRCGKKWKAQIQIGGVQYYVGVFETEELAAAEYNKAAENYGRKANLFNKNHTNEFDVKASEKDLPVGLSIPEPCSSAENNREFVLKLRLGRITRALFVGQNILSSLLLRTSFVDTATPLNELEHKSLLGKANTCIRRLIAEQTQLLDMLVATVPHPLYPTVSRAQGPTDHSCHLSSSSPLEDLSLVASSALLSGEHPTARQVSVFNDEDVDVMILFAKQDKEQHDFISALESECSEIRYV